ncbi:hypothetical protein T07_11853 [Trichinella nelsoni]|uniref:Uncharacterized protein n=1 Tax=Trichinella nelsoni TaxID=6336 RepID=A0A0V0RI56_9BILA|nr:hypothetical protein T07_11853 [Trichinella nelsoni]
MKLDAIEVIVETRENVFQQLSFVKLYKINLLFIQRQTIFKAWIIFMLNSVTVKKMDELAQNSVEWLNLYTFHIFQNFQAK